MERFCEKIAKYLLNTQKASDDEIDEVRFGIELILTQTILFLIILTIGFYRNMIMETLVFMVALVVLRTFVNGYHADSFYKCMFLTTLFYLTTIYFASFGNIYFLILTVIFAAKAFYFQQNESNENERISQWIFVGCLIVMILFYQLNALLVNIIGFTLFFTGISMEVEKYGCKKQNCIVSEESIT